MSDMSLIMIHIFSEVSDLDTGLLLEVWEKGMLWDKAIGYYWCPLNTIPFTKQVRTSVFFTLFFGVCCQIINGTIKFISLTMLLQKLFKLMCEQKKCSHTCE